MSSKSAMPVVILLLAVGLVMFSTSRAATRKSIEKMPEDLIEVGESFEFVTVWSKFDGTVLAPPLDGWVSVEIGDGRDFYLNLSQVVGIRPARDTSVLTIQKSPKRWAASTMKAATENR